MRSIIAIIMIIASVAGIIAYIVPQYNTIQEAREELAEYDVALDNATKLQAEREKLLTRFNEFSNEDVEALEKLLPDNIDNVKLIIELDALAARYGMAIQNVNVIDEVNQQQGGATEQSRPYGTVDLEFSIAGPYDRFVSFIEDVETSLRLIDVYDIVFQTPVTSNNYEYRVKIRTYWLK